MKAFRLTVILCALNFSAFSQITDTCDFVAQNNYIGGLDCYVGSLAGFTADSYQWLDCDNSYAVIPGQTSDPYTGMTSITVALEISYLGCVDTSDCSYVCTWGIEELSGKERELVNIVDIMGRETEDKPNTLLIYVYNDGTTEKVFRIE
jgi:hypothetical protein